MNTETITISKRKQQVIWGLRILLSFLFLISAVAKLYPSPYFAMTTFEIKQLLPMGFSETAAAYFSRTLIGCEFALGFLLLQPHFLKRLVIPVSFLMLLIFVIELTYEIASSGNSGNCGCFGTLIPMTPLEAIIKNIIAMGMLGYLFKVIPENPAKKNFSFLMSITLASVLAVFMLGPIQPAQASGTPANGVVEVVDEPDSDNTNTIAATGTDDKTTTDGKSTTTTDPGKTVDGKDPKNATEPADEKVDEPAKKKSGFSSLFPDIDKDKKILCFFAPGCEHCKETAKELTQMKNQVKDFPDIRIAFMDEEAELIPAFFEFAGAKYTHSVLDIATFWKTVGNRDTPGVFYIWNGNIVKVYDGIEGNAFKAKEFKALVQKPWSEVK
ncbi:MAG TPA: MauE/DoxX family redox-associated membrane protein [Fluviicola sp.]|nr:MauE/DoxX family redox-associated membrane protein [Fluviicola sp.]